VAGSCGHGNKPCGPIKGKQFLGSLQGTKHLHFTCSGLLSNEKILFLVSVSYNAACCCHTFSTFTSQTVDLELLEDSHVILDCLLQTVIIQ
jgi:hypothetical protein